MKLGVFSDTHIGRSIPKAISHLRRKAYRYSFTKAIDVFIKEGVDYVIHAGDVFEKRSMGPEDSLFVKEELHRLVEQLEKAGKNPKIFVVRGNHDGTPENNALDFVKHPLAKYMRVLGDQILDGKEETVTNGSISLAGIGYHPYIRNRFASIKPILEQAFTYEDVFRILVMHNFIDGYHYLPPGCPTHATVKLEEIAALPVNLIICGHYHGNLGAKSDHEGQVILTPGGTEAIDLSDEGPFGVYIINVEGRNLSPSFVEIEPMHKIKSTKVDSQNSIKPLEWYREKVLAESSFYIQELESSRKNGILKVVMEGLTDQDPLDLEPVIDKEIGDLKGNHPCLVHFELLNAVKRVGATFEPPAFGGRAAYLEEAFQPISAMLEEALKISEDVDVKLEEKASQRTGLLTDADRREFVGKWLCLLEKIEV